MLSHATDEVAYIPTLVRLSQETTGVEKGVGLTLELSCQRFQEGPPLFFFCLRRESE